MSPSVRATDHHTDGDTVSTEEVPVTPSTEEEYLRVSGGTNAQTLASAIAQAVFESGGRKVQLRAVGAGAVNQAVKAIAIARGLVAPRGIDLTCRPGFQSIESRDGRISSIVLLIVVG